MTYSSLAWDGHYKCIIGECPPPKGNTSSVAVKSDTQANSNFESQVSEPKSVAFVAGPSKDMCFFKAWGDRQVLNAGNTAFAFDQDGNPWLFPEFKSTKSPGTRLGNILKVMRTCNKNVEYKNFQVPSLPADVSAAGVRPGCCNELAEKLPIEHVVWTTGHSHQGAGALDYYFRDLSYKLMNGASIMGG